MPVFDPTSVAHSVPAPISGLWSVEDVARMQAEIVEALVSGPSPVSTVAAEAPVVAVSATGQKTSISGRYRSTGEVELELRVDVDGERPTRRVSGDFFRRTGGTLTYVGSFIVNAPAITISSNEISIDGEGVFTFPSGSPRIRLRIPRVPALAPAGAATAQFLTPSGVPGATFSCQYESPFFRTIEFEQDVVGGVQPFISFETSRLQSPGRVRTLTGSSCL
jgi:hypothetical protein